MTEQSTDCMKRSSLSVHIQRRLPQA